MSAQLAYDGSRAFSAATPVADAMTPEQKYLFDLNGFIIIRGVLSEEEIAAAHAAIDAHTPLFKERAEKALRNTRDGTPLAGDGNTPRLDLGGMLGWPKPHCDIFRKLLCHPKLVPYLKELCGEVPTHLSPPCPARAWRVISSCRPCFSPQAALCDRPPCVIASR